MPSFGPVSRRDLIAALRRLGFTGPVAGGRHEFMLFPDGRRRLTLPNPHGGEISRSFLSDLLRQADISKTQWEQA